MIDFELTPEQKEAVKAAHQVAEELFRPISRYFDEHEHESPQELIDKLWEKRREGSLFVGLDTTGALRVEEACWGDAGLYLCVPSPGLGGAAIFATGTQEQIQRFLGKYNEGGPKWGAMAMTEAACGSDTSAISATAVRDGDEWVLNGEKIFVTCGKRAMENPESVLVVWATVDKSAGRAGMKSFVVPAGTPGAKVEKMEKKLGIRASDTVTIVLDNCRIPYENILGSPEVRTIDKTKTAGFKKAMATFDATRPIVAAQALGIGRAALDFVKETLEKEGIEIRYGLPRQKLTALERDVMDMEANYKAAKLLTLRSLWMMSQFLPNNLEASMAKAKAGLAVTKITQKAVELMGPLGYSRKFLLEKWMRDAKINDIFEGTGQINMLVVARRILDYSRGQLK
ncbi:MAG: acyl-CoA dehydrogenase family protein [Chloroflexi bacterium]|jgi:acyl-CoA dehydrogenase|nr:acyl-CoA dehydrogenase family protein [Chloroflexota bacterium]